MKIAIISDIHGNIEALTSVIADIEKEGCSKIFCLGDLVMAGPNPISTLNTIHEFMSNKNFHIIQGNTDKMLSVFSFDTYNEIMKVAPVMASAYLADSQLLSEEDKLFLANLPIKEEIIIGNVKILLVHGSPRKNNENIYPDLSIKEVEEMIKDTDANVIFCGHTHVPCGYQTNTEQTVVNVGSVGRPFAEDPKATYAIMEIDETINKFTIKHQFVEYNVQKASNTLKERGFEGSEKLAQMLIKATSRYPK